VGSVSIRSISGGWDGRALLVNNISSATTYEHEQPTGTTTTNRFNLANTTNWTTDAGAFDLLYYDGNAGRWRLYKNRTFALLNVSGSAGVGSLSVTGTSIHNGNTTLGNAPTDIITIGGHADGAALLIGRQIFTSSGTYTPTSGTYKVRVQMVAGGGGSGGCDTDMGVASGGGASGTYFEKWIDPSAAITGGAVTIGAGGTAGSTSGGAGGAGGDTSVVVQGTTYTAKGGSGGAGSTGTTTGVGGTAPVAGSSSGDLVYQEPGLSGVTTGATTGGRGGSNPLGAGGVGAHPEGTTNDGSSGSGYGAGAGGCRSTSGHPGAAGTAGVAIIWEYR
jgi:hypothetical protein